MFLRTSGLWSFNSKVDGSPSQLSLLFHLFLSLGFFLTDSLRDFLSTEESGADQC